MIDNEKIFAIGLADNEKRIVRKQYVKYVVISKQDQCQQHNRNSTEMIQSKYGKVFIITCGCVINKLFK